MRTRGRYFSRTGLTKEVAILAAPLILQNLSVTLLGVVDTYFVSRLSTEALAAVGLAGVMFFALLVFFRGIANSSVVFVGRAHGAKDDEAVGRDIWHVLSVVLLFSSLTLVMPFLFTWLFALASPADSETVRQLGTHYLQIRAFEMPLQMFSAVVWGFLVGRGDSRTPMLIAWATVILNIILDWMLVLGNLGMPQLGVAGAAYATLIAAGFNAVVSALILFAPEARRRFGTGKFKFSNWSDLKRVMNIGLPMGFGDFIEVASFSVFFAIIARLGDEILAANQIALQYMSISFTAGVAVGMATSSLVSKYLGAKEPEKAERVGYRAVYLGMALMGLIGLTYLIAPNLLIGFFSEDADVIQAGAVILRLVAFYQIFDALAIVFASALNGAGDTRFTMYTKTILAWGMFIPLSWLFAFPLKGGLAGAWIAALIYLGGLGFVYLWRFRSGKWKTISLEAESSRADSSTLS